MAYSALQHICCRALKIGPYSYAVAAADDDADDDDDDGDDDDDDDKFMLPQT